MADIITPEIKVFANERGRPMADVIEQMYQTGKRFQQEWAAMVINVTPPNTSDQIADGSETSRGANADGRKPFTGAQLNNLKTLVDAFVTYLETGNPSRIAQVQQVTTNGQARF